MLSWTQYFLWGMREWPTSQAAAITNAVVVVATCGVWVVLPSLYVMRVQSPPFWFWPLLGMGAILLGVMTILSLILDMVNKYTHDSVPVGLRTAINFFTLLTTLVCIGVTSRHDYQVWLAWSPPITLVGIWIVSGCRWAWMREQEETGGQSIRIFTSLNL